MKWKTTGVTLALATGLGVAGAACSVGTNAEDAAHRLAVERLAGDDVRLTVDTALSTPSHQFYLASRDGDARILIVVPKGGAPFSADQPDAFDRVARREDAARRVRELGAERIAMWHASLSESACPPPASDEAHFAQASVNRDGGVLVTYQVAGPIAPRSCVIELGADGALASTRVEEQLSPAPAPADQASSLISR